MIDKNFPSIISVLPLILGFFSTNRIAFASGILFTFFISLLKFTKKIHSILPNWFSALVILNLMALLFSNLYNGNSYIGKPQIYYVGISILSLSTFFNQLRNLHEKQIFVFSCFLVGPINFLLNNKTGLNIWKYSLGLSCTLCILFFIRKKSTKILLLLVSIGLSWKTNAISLMMIILIGLILVTFQDENDVSVKPSSRKKSILIFFFLALLLVGLVMCDLFFIESGYTRRLLSEFLLGRPEIWINFETITGSPILGWGSLHIPTSHDLYSAFDLAKSYGFNLRENIIYYWGNPNQNWLQSHSMLADFWIKGGFFAALMVFGLIWICMARIFSHSREKSALTPVLAISLIWDILFSANTALSGLQIVAFLGLLEIEKSSIQYRQSNDDCSNKFFI